MKGKPSPEFDRTTRLFTPDGYHNLPPGRAGGTIGLAVIPKITAKSDGAERAIAEVVGHIPSINMVISLPPNDPLYLFKFLKHLKESGRKVDVLMIAGHALQKIENDDVFAIKLGDDQSQWLTPASLNASNLATEIEKLGKSVKNFSSFMMEVRPWCREHSSFCTVATSDMKTRLACSTPLPRRFLELTAVRLLVPSTPSPQRCWPVKNHQASGLPWAKPW
jgi:hypothetical protein